MEQYGHRKWTDYSVDENAAEVEFEGTDDLLLLVLNECPLVLSVPLYSGMLPVDSRGFSQVAGRVQGEMSLTVTEASRHWSHPNYVGFVSEEGDGKLWEYGLARLLEHDGAKVRRGSSPSGELTRYEEHVPGELADDAPQGVEDGAQGDATPTSDSPSPEPAPSRRGRSKASQEKA